MKIGMVHPFFCCKGGAERKVLLLSRELLKRGHDVWIFTHIKNSESSFSEYMNGLNIQATGYLRFLMGKIIHILKLSSKLRDLDVIHAHNFPADLESVISKRIRNIPVIWFCNEPILFESATMEKTNPFYLKIQQNIEKILAKNIDIIVANSNYTKERIRETLKADARVICSGVDISVFKPQKKVETQRPTLLTVSRLVRHKNISFLLECIERIWQEHPEAQLIIVGEGDYREILERKMRSQKIVFTGNVTLNVLLSYLSKCSVFVFPSIKEPLGVTVLEAMACERPVVGFASGGVKETIIHGKTGFLAENNEEFSDYVLSLLADERLREKLGKAGRKSVIEKFSLQKMVDETEKLYEEVAG